ncbi:unnamed protein product [Eruca vesicaria subsp. sativa]|uniref:Uncharacterized protein n=1 Tax=Eruca vesicaria subsp. sativa TaxID=29727 RepID=A0ABC8JSL7_ERUVS|nr:unnamed protein product [Eruca vesicaria subsp. sativa]
MEDLKFGFALVVSFKNVSTSLQALSHHAQEKERSFVFILHNRSVYVAKCKCETLAGWRQHRRSDVVRPRQRRATRTNGQNNS